MKKKLILGVIAAAAAVVLLCAFPRYTLVGLVGLLVGWAGRVLYAKHLAR